MVITELGLRTLTLSTRRTVAFNGSDGEERARIRALGDELTWETGLLLVARDRVAIGPTIEYGVNTRRTGIRARHARTDGVTVETRLGAMRAHPGREAVPSGSEARAGHGATVSTRVMFGGDFSVGLSYDDLAWPDQPLSSGRRYVGSPRARALALDVALGGDTGTLFAVGLVGAAALVVLTFALPCPCPGQPPETVSAARAAR